nr:hypothetical protein [Ligilactobacillus acidipiscis]
MGEQIRITVHGDTDFVDKSSLAQTDPAKVKKDESAKANEYEHRKILVRKNG